MHFNVETWFIFCCCPHSLDVTSDALNFVVNTILCYYVLRLLRNLMHQTLVPNHKNIEVKLPIKESIVKTV